jgi:transcriptional regulator with XRE-family HTH domain
MRRSLASLVATRRRRSKLSLGDVARLAGYRNVNKGSNRLAAIERGDDAFPDARVLTRFAGALSIDSRDIDQALCEDFEGLDRPVSPSAVDRVMPGVYLPIDLPANCTQKRAMR